MENKDIKDGVEGKTGEAGEIDKSWQPKMALQGKENPKITTLLTRIVGTFSLTGALQEECSSEVVSLQGGDETYVIPTAALSYARDSSRASLLPVLHSLSSSWSEALTPTLPSTCLGK